jgi:hypothetical protein
MIGFSRLIADHSKRTRARLNGGLLLVVAVLAIIFGLLAIERADEVLGRMGRSADRPMGLIDMD